MAIRNVGTPHKEKWWRQSAARTHLVYYLLIHHIADDQGRFKVDGEEICHELREKTLNPSNLKQSITELAHEGILMLYKDTKDNEYAQFIDWWRLQSKSQWMQKSELPAPAGWEDAWRITGPKRKIIKSDNWDDKENGAGLIPVSTGSTRFRVGSPIPSQS